MLSPETILQQRYRIVRQLGQGGMGAVYEAVDQRLDTVVALKETLFADERLRKQFEREARLLARLHHPALPRVSDHFTEADGQFLVMQYIGGEDLAEMLQQRKSAFPQEQVLAWADQLCDALDYLHTQDPQIIHRDIKPQNLKLTTRGQIVLLDFGLAKGSAGQLSVVTTSASIFGYTPNYAPLEQVQGLGTDARSDIYSLAATLYHLMTNVKPPDALSRAAAIVNGQTDPLVPASEVTAVSPAIASALAKGMSQNRAERFASAADMRQALRTAATEPMREAPTLTGGAATPVVAGTLSSEDRTKVVGASTQVEGSEARTLVAAETTNVPTRAQAGERVTAARASSKGRRGRPWLAAAVLLMLIVGGAGAFYAYRKRQQPAQPNTGASANPAQPSQSAAQGTESNKSVTQVNPAQEEGKKPAQTANQKPRPDTTTERAAVTRSKPKAAPEPAKTTKSAGDRPTHDAERERDRAREQNIPPVTPVSPNFDPFKNQPHPPGAGAGQLPNVRTMPNGTKVITQPDGTRILVMPNGATRVIPPDAKMIRKQRHNP
jgi:serine/threonine protein kinase